MIEESMDLREILSILKKRIKLIVILSVVFAIAGYAFSKYLITPQYEADATMIVNSSDVQSTSITYDQITAAQQLVSTYAVILKSDPMMKQVKKNLGLDITPGELAGCVTVTGVNQTEVMDIAVTYPNAHTAAAIANEITRVSPAYIIKTVKAGSVEVISKATANGAPSSPNVKQNTLIAMLAGLIISVLLALTVEMINNKLDICEDIEKSLGITVLGIIPAVKNISNGEKEAKTVKGNGVLNNA